MTRILAAAAIGTGPALLGVFLPGLATLTLAVAAVALIALLHIAGRDDIRAPVNRSR